MAEQGLGNVRVVRSGCLGLCGAGPAAVTYPAGDVYLRVQPEDAAEMAGAVSGGGRLARRIVRAPQWYRDRIVARLDYLIQYLAAPRVVLTRRGRAPPGRTPNGHRTRIPVRWDAGSAGGGQRAARTPERAPHAERSPLGHGSSRGRA